MVRLEGPAGQDSEDAMDGADQTTRDPERFRIAVRSWLEARLPRQTDDTPATIMGAGEGSEAIDRGRRYLALLAEQGWSRPAWPARYGGGGLPPEDAAIVTDELANFQAPDLYMFTLALEQVGATILNRGSEEQKERWLLPITTGANVWCQLFSEPGAGSDLAGLSTRAERDGQRWLVTGQKTWVSRAHHADWGLLLARHDTSLPKHQGITAFAVDMTSPGIEIRPIRQMNGDSHFNEVFLDAVPVADRDRIGAVGDGWRIAVETLMNERTKAGRSGGGDLVDIEGLLALVARRGAGKDPLVRQTVSKLYIETKLNERIAARSRAVAAQGGSVGPEGSGYKLRRSAILRGIADAALSLGGCSGAVEDDEWQTLFLTVPSVSIRGGTDEIQRNVIAERVLGLPRDPRPDKDVPFRELR
jgi:alkylation response protein AidB-like acyl-CoA dehydrogenase